MRINQALFRLHGVLGLIASLPLVVICASGALLVFKHEIDTLLMADRVRADQVLPSRLSLDELHERIDSAFADYEMVGWAVFEDPGRADLVYLMRRGSSDWSYTLLDPYTGEFLAPVVGTTHYLTDWLLDLHFALLMSEPGMVLVAVSGVLLCLLGLSGLWLHRKFWKTGFAVRWRGRAIVCFSDLHKAVGVIAVPVLLILGFTGVWWNTSALLHEWREHADGVEHHVMQRRLYGDISLSNMAAVAGELVPGFTLTYISMPFEPERPVVLWGDVAAANPLLSQYASQVRFDPHTGEVMSFMDIRQAPVSVRVVDTYRRLHFGDFGGLATRVLWAVLGAAPLLMVVTGMWLWLLRRRSRRRGGVDARSCAVQRPTS